MNLNNNNNKTYNNLKNNYLKATTGNKQKLVNGENKNN